MRQEARRKMGETSAKLHDLHTYSILIYFNVSVYVKIQYFFLCDVLALCHLPVLRFFVRPKRSDEKPGAALPRPDSGQQVLPSCVPWTGKLVKAFVFLFFFFLHFWVAEEWKDADIVLLVSCILSLIQCCHGPCVEVIS